MVSGLGLRVIGGLSSKLIIAYTLYGPCTDLSCPMINLFTRPS